MNDLLNDTICAISTPPGVGGIAIIRVSGPEAVRFTDTIWRGKELSTVGSHTAHLGLIVDPTDGSRLDEAVATVFRAPRSFTGQDVVELSVHGSVYVQHKLLRLLVSAGCRIAEPGEFTRRAFAAGRLDLAEAEAVADLIASTSASAHRLAISQMRGDLSRCLKNLRESLIDLASLLELELDFSEEHVEFASRSALVEKAEAVLSILKRLERTYTLGNSIRRGIPIAIVGAPNVGKSTLLNALLDSDRAIVSDIPGTTRDTIEDILEIDGMTFRIADTAGIRETDDTIESLGIERALHLAGSAAILLRLIDATDPHLPQLPSNTDATVITVITKSDRPDADIKAAEHIAGDNDTFVISALHREGIDTLLKRIGMIGQQLSPAEGEILLTDARHHQAVIEAIDDINRVISGLHDQLSGDFIAQDLRSALYHLGQITGQITTPELLSTVFSRFCIGK